MKRQLGTIFCPLYQLIYQKISQFDEYFNDEGYIWPSFISAEGIEELYVDGNQRYGWK